ncbi:MAG: thiamine phosphate synthase [Nitrospirae bacterium CG_4_9_14_3_um_filter_53_35]|nr:MAG: thiamine phosphate synthase [Nitrospirae bacterium CG_4_8_14_3_um_filter_50_41]PJA75873.1 MAG: thiamine phosphate synthase [Nitrospirae bacterium CG_4_9_14_3_um_filter_53_35]
MKPIDFELCLITDRRQVKDEALLPELREALEGGVQAIQLREKDWSDRRIFETGLELRKLTREFGARLFINDRADLAAAVESDGVHLTQSGYSAAEARKIIGDSKYIGVSTHSLEEAARAQEDGADFITFGPVFETPSKRAYGPPVGLDRLSEVTRKIRIPVFAVGGINKENTHAVLDAGAHGIALISGILTATDVRKAAREFISLINERT